LDCEAKSAFRRPFGSLCESHLRPVRNASACGYGVTGLSSVSLHWTRTNRSGTFEEYGTRRLAMRMPTSVVAVVVCTLLVSPSRGWCAAPTVKDPPDAAVLKVRELQKERIAVLKDLTEVLDKLYTGSRVEIDEALQARQLLLEAELEAAKTEAE